MNMTQEHKINDLIDNINTLAGLLRGMVEDFERERDKLADRAEAYRQQALNDFTDESAKLLLLSDMVYERSSAFNQAAAMARDYASIGKRIETDIARED